MTILRALRSGTCRALIATTAIAATLAVATELPVSAVNVPTPNWVAPVFNGSGTVTAGPNGTSYAYMSVTSNSTFGSNNITIVGTNDAVLVKRLADGTVDWVLQVQESTNAVGVSSVVLDANNNSYIRGSLGAVTATFGAISVTGVSTGTSYLAKVNPSGVVQWVKLMTSATHLETYWTTIDPTDGAIYVSGRHRGVTSGTVTVASPGAHIDAFVMKFDSSGNALWGKSFGSTATDMAYRTAVDPSGNVIVVGAIQCPGASATLTLDSLPAITLTGTAAANRQESFVAKMSSSDGSFIWGTTASGASDEELLGVKTDASGNIYVTGWFASSSLTVGSTTLTNLGSNDVWLAKLNSSGQFQWARSGGGSDVDAAFTLVMDSSDNIYIAGYFGAYGSTTKNGVFGSTTLVSAGATLGLGDGFVASWSSAGTFRWATSVETATGHGFVGTLGLSDNGDLFAHANSISGNVVVQSITGTYAGTNGGTVISYGNVATAPTTTTTTTTTSTTSTTSTTTTVPTSSTNAPSTTVASGGGGASTSGGSTNSTSTTVASGMGTPAPSTSSSTTSTTTTVAPAAPEIDLGEGGVMIGGKSAATTITRADNTILVSGGGVEATIYGENSDGDRIDLDENGDLRLSLGDSIVVEAKGFESDSAVDVWMYSTPTRLGELEVQASGSGTGTFSLPAAAEPGDHRVVLDGATGEGQDVVLGLGIAVGELDTGSFNRLLIAAPLALAILVALLVPSVLRRRRDDPATA